MDISSGEVLLLVLCIILSAFFSGTETALTSIPEPRLMRIVEAGTWRGRGLALWAKNPNKVLTSILIGNNIVNIAAGAVAAEVALRWSKSYGTAVATGVMTVLILIIGEVTPKTFARMNAEKFAPVAITVLKPVYWLLYPFAWLLSRFSKSMIYSFGGKENGKQPKVSEEEIEYMIDLGHREGVISDDKEQMLQSIFELSESVIREVMIPRTDLVALSISSTVEEIIETVLHDGHSRYPVFEEDIDDIKGILYTKDLFKAVNEVGQAGIQIDKIMRRPLFVPETQKINEVLKTLQNRRFHLAIVVDEFGGTSGVVTIEDILEEIVGEIHDEHDVVDEPIEKMAQHKFLVDARMPLRDLEDELNLTFPEDGGFDTLGGFVIEQEGKVPKVGCQIVWEGHLFTIREADERRVIKVEIVRNKIQDESQSEDC